jgi:endonuclease YncB( thermonuclease family)
MDLEGFVLSTIPLVIAAAHKAPGEVASVINGSFLLADGPGVRLAAIEPPLQVPSGEDEGHVESALAATAARETRLSGATLVPPQEVLATGPAPASPVAVAATCRIYLRNAERDARKTGFGLWSAAYRVVKQASDWADVLAQQERFALVGGRASC